MGLLRFEPLNFRFKTTITGEPLDLEKTKNFQYQVNLVAENRLLKHNMVSALRCRMSVVTLKKIYLTQTLSTNLKILKSSFLTLNAKIKATQTIFLSPCVFSYFL